MRKSLVLLATLTLMTIPATAFAVPPQVVTEEEVTFSEVFPAGTVCPFEVSREGTESWRVTEFYSKDGSLTSVHEHVRGTTTYFSSYGEASENFAGTNVIDLETQTFTANGNAFNIHAGVGGVLVNDSGRIVIDLKTFEALVINGPRQSWQGDFTDLCEALDP